MLMFLKFCQAYTSCASEYLVLAVNINTWTFTSAVTSFKFYINRMVAVDQVTSKTLEYDPFL